MLSHFSLVQLCNTVDSSHQVPLAMGFPRQENWNGLPCPSPGEFKPKDRLN